MSTVSYWCGLRHVVHAHFTLEGLIPNVVVLDRFKVGSKVGSSLRSCSADQPDL